MGWRARVGAERWWSRSASRGRGPTSRAPLKTILFHLHLIGLRSRRRRYARNSQGKRIWSQRRPIQCAWNTMSHIISLSLLWYPERSKFISWSRQVSGAHSFQFSLSESSTWLCKCRLRSTRFLGILYFAWELSQSMWRMVGLAWRVCRRARSWCISWILNLSSRSSRAIGGCGLRNK